MFLTINKLCPIHLLYLINLQNKFKRMPFLIVITDPGNIDIEDEIINSLFNSGLNYLHLRKPDWPKEKISLLIQKNEEKHRNKISIHSNYELAYEYGLKGIHLTSDFISKNTNTVIEETINQAKNNKMTVSASVHSLQEIENLKYSFDYVFLSPVFNSISKQNYASAFNLNELTIFFKSYKSNCKIIALGGIDASNIKSVYKCGFHGAALLGAIWKQENKVEIFKKICNSITSI
jgi:thiamine-phosphate pyrophosphorylase